MSTSMYIEGMFLLGDAVYMVEEAHRIECHPDDTITTHTLRRPLSIGPFENVSHSGLMSVQSCDLRGQRRS